MNVPSEYLKKLVSESCKKAEDKYYRHIGQSDSMSTYFSGKLVAYNELLSQITLMERDNDQDQR